MQSTISSFIHSFQLFMLANIRESVDGGWGREPKFCANCCLHTNATLSLSDVFKGDFQTLDQSEIRIGSALSLPMVQHSSNDRDRPAKSILICKAVLALNAMQAFC